MCDQEFKSTNGLYAHIYKVHEERKGKKCNVCQKTFSLQDQLSAHMKRMHENKKYHKCNSCQISFYDIAALKRYITLWASFTYMPGH